MNKKVIIAISAVVVVAIVVCLIIFLPKSSNEKELKANLEKLGKQFYEGFYYPQQETTQSSKSATMAEYLSKYAATGFKVDLENMAKVSSVDKKLVESMVNSKTNEKCNEKNTTVTIYPKEPYGVTDYEIKVNLDCGFKK